MLGFRKMLGWGYRALVKPVFFLMDPEFIHDRMTQVGEWLGKSGWGRGITQRLFAYSHPRLEQRILGLTFKNPVGLSAGFDKDGRMIAILPSVGFSFMEVGSLTHKPYEGNPKPRLYRLPKSRGLVVYYGLKNQGVEQIIPRIKRGMGGEFLVGVSVAKTNCKETASDEAGAEDYAAALGALVEAEAGDFYTINISCPNTFGGEPFTTPERLELLLKTLKPIRMKRPVLVKMPINLPWNEFEKLLKVIVKYRVDGVVIGNLTKVRDKLIKDEIPKHVQGGISGKPTEKLNNDLIARTYKEFGKRLVIVGVGGIFSAEDAYKKIRLGASLVELITGMIYQGPQLIGEINQGLVELMERDGFERIEDVVGTLSVPEPR